jgi:hypothetical protein
MGSGSAPRPRWRASRLARADIEFIRFTLSNSNGQMFAFSRRMTPEWCDRYAL